MDNRFEQLLGYALRNKVTDIHFEMVDMDIRIFMRSIKGILDYPTESDDKRLINYLQYKAHLDITSQAPQSGSFNYYYKKKYYSFRLAVINLNNRVDGVLRILNFQNGLSLDEITFQKDIQQLFLSLIRKRSGLIIFSGLTSSGKTTTMYSLIQLIKGKSIYSIEDPIEVYLPNIVQLEINKKIGFDYDQAIRQILRHNPDVLMIGEIRDEETAKMAIRASLTGSLVLTSIHSKSCKGAINRLKELSVKQADIKETILMVFNQRLCKCYKENKYICLFDNLDSQQVVELMENGKTIDNMSLVVEKAVKDKKIDPRYLDE